MASTVRLASPFSFVVQLRHALDLSQIQLAKILSSSVGAVSSLEICQDPELRIQKFDRLGTYTAFISLLVISCQDRMGVTLRNTKAYIHGAKTDILADLARNSNMFDETIIKCLSQGSVVSLFMAQHCDAVLRDKSLPTMCDMIASVMGIRTYSLRHLNFPSPISEESILAALRVCGEVR